MCTLVGVSVKRRPSGRWQARWRDATGRQRAKDFDRKIDAAAHEAKMRATTADGTYVDTASKLTVRDWADQWLAGARNLGAGGRETYRRDLDRYILPTIGDMGLHRLTGDVVDELLEELLKRGLAASTVHRQYRTIRRMCQVAVERRKLGVNPCALVTPPRVRHEEMRFLTVEEVDDLASAISVRYRAWVYLAAYGGLRWSECVGLRRARVEDDRVAITEQLVRRDDGQWHRDRPKTTAGVRTVSVPRFVADELATHLDTFALPGPDGLVFPNRNASPLIASTFTTNVFKRACVRAGLARWEDETKRKVLGGPRVHDLRHTAVALAIRVGAHPKAIQARMGHASITTTLDRYGHLFPEQDATVAARLDDLRRGQVDGITQR
jgi:integrase